MISQIKYVKTTIVIYHPIKGWVQQCQRVEGVRKIVVKNAWQSPNSSPKNVKVEIKKFEYKKG